MASSKTLLSATAALVLATSLFWTLASSSASPNSADSLAFIKKTISSNKIAIFSKSYCPYVVPLSSVLFSLISCNFDSTSHLFDLNSAHLLFCLIVQFYVLEFGVGLNFRLIRVGWGVFGFVIIDGFLGFEEIANCRTPKFELTNSPCRSLYYIRLSPRSKRKKNEQLEVHFGF